MVQLSPIPAVTAPPPELVFVALLSLSHSAFMALCSTVWAWVPAGRHWNTPLALRRHFGIIAWHLHAALALGTAADLT